uniref:DNA-directed DNA polymerase n=1 Tax=Setaria digitata TaxID=48799 RepID=A0A915PPE7_9BILA
MVETDYFDFGETVSKGESIVVCNKNQLDVVQRIIQQKAIFARRCEIKRRRIKLIIEAICSGLCSNENELKNLLSLLFFDGEVAMEKELNFLLTRKLIYHQQNLGLRGTQLGRAVFSSSLSPDIALQVYNDLEKAMRSLALDTELHLLYLVTPLHNDSIWMNYIDWNAYYKIWSKLPIRLQRVGKMIGILDSFILGKLQGRQATETSNLQVHLRFLSALALFDLIKECPLGDVARRFRINRGALQTLQQQSATYAYMVVTFCEKLGWTYLRSVLDGFSERLTFGVRKDLTELVQIEGIDGVRARACHNANITTVATLAITSVDDITKILRSAVPFIRRNNSEGLNRWLAGEGLMTDVEAAKLLIQRARQKLSSSLRAVGIFSDAKIDSLFSTVKSINEIDCDNLDDHNGKCGDNQDFASDPADLEFTSLDFLTHGSCPVTTASENSEEQNSASTQSLAQTSEVTEKKLSEMELLKSDELDEMKQTVLHDYSGNNYETLDIPDRLKSDDVEQLCLNFSHTSMSDETLLRFGCSQSSGKIEQITQTLDAVTVLANNEKFARIKSAKQDEQVTTDLGIFQSSNISSLIQNENPISATAEALNLEIYNDNKQSDEEQNFINSKLNELSVIQFSESSSTDQSAFAMQQPIPLGSIEEEKEIVVNSSEKIGNQSTFDSSADLFDQTFCSSVNSQSINTPHNSSHSFKRINRRSSISQSSRSPSFQSPLHKVLKLESSFTTSTGTEIKFNKSVQGDVGHFTNDQTEATEFQIIDVCGSCTTWKQLLTRQKYWDQIGLGIAWCSRNVIGVALCALNEKCFYIDFTRKDGYAVEFHERLTALDNLLKSEQQKYIYDLPSVSRSLRSLQNSKCQNWQLNNCICVQTLSYLAHYRSSDNDSPLSFQDLLSRLTSPERAAILKNATPRLQAVINSFICLHMHDDLMSAAIRLSSTQSVKLEMQSVVLFSKIEATGISFDANQAKSLADKLKRKMTEVETKAYHIAGISFNFASASEISQVLFVRLRIPPPNISTGRHYSTNKMVLQRLAPKYPIVNLILDWRRMNTALTASLPILLNSCCSDGRIRATFAINCSTGRVLTMNPNVQNVQKQPVIDGFSIRSLFIAPTGRILLSSDYRQLEMRILAHLSDDPYLISMFLAKGDFFETVATKWNANENFYMKVDRNKVKQLCYGILYGMGATTLSKELNIQKQHAQQLIVSFFQQFPKVRIWMDKILTICRADGYVSTFLGRRRYLPNISDMLQMESAQAERQAINTCIQGSAAELFKIALLKLQKNLSDTNSSIVMQLHDEVLVETDENSVASVVEIIRNSMISAIPNLRVPLVVRISSGKSWGELQEYVEI